MNELCEREERGILNELYQDVLFLLKDSDVLEIKEQIKDALKNMSTTTTYVVIGEGQAGKTSLLKILFEDIIEIPEKMESDICEYRWGEQAAETLIEDGFQKKFFPVPELQGLSIIDSKGIREMSPNTLHKMKELVGISQVVFVVLDISNINSSKVWDVIEDNAQKNMIFFITKCDLVSEKDLQAVIEKTQLYIHDAGISAKLFPVTTKESKKMSGIVPIDSVRTYIKESIIGQNPILSKQQDNIYQLDKILSEFKESLSLRQRQYRSDAKILQKINNAMDHYVINQQEMIDTLITKVTREINKDIENYQHEIISKMDPYKIKERFHCQEDFENYLNMVNDNYKKMMTDSINRKAVETMKECLHNLELVFQESVGYFNKRKEILRLEDKFYGSMSQSRRKLVDETRNVSIEVIDFYKTLTEASEELFLQIWHAREEYERSINTAGINSAICGGGGVGTVGGAVGYFLAKSIVAMEQFKKLETATAVAASLGIHVGLTFGLLIIGAIVGGIFIHKMAKPIYEAKAADKMEEAVKESINEFKQEVEHTRKSMIEQITEQITDLFSKELKFADNCFIEFRMSVNIDEQKLPELENKLEKAENLLKQIRRIGAQEYVWIQNK